MSMPYHSIKSKMWGSRNGTYREILRTYGDSTAIVAAYLISSPHAKQSGIYLCPLMYIATETERTIDEVEQCLHNLEKIHFCKYDFEEEVVWVFKMVMYQVAPEWTELRKNVDSKKKQDSRFQGILNTLEDIKHSYLYREFCQYWWRTDIAPPNIISDPSGASGSPAVEKDSPSYQTDHKEPVHAPSKPPPRPHHNPPDEGYGKEASS